MPSQNSMQGGALKIAQNVSAAATQVTVTIAAPTDNVRNTIAVYGLCVSWGSVPAGAVACLLQVAGVTVMTFYITQDSYGPASLWFGNHPYVAAAGAVTLVIPSFGFSTIASGQLFYQIVTV